MVLNSSENMPSVLAAFVGGGACFL